MSKELTMTDRRAIFQAAMVIAVDMYRDSKEGPMGDPDFPDNFETAFGLAEKLFRENVHGEPLK